MTVVKAHKRSGLDNSVAVKSNAILIGKLSSLVNGAVLKQFYLHL